MRVHTIHITFLLAGLVAAASACAAAQTDAALSAYGAFSGTTIGNGVQQSPANQAGGMIELRHIVNPLVGYEAAYSFNRANQEYISAPPSNCGLVCAQTLSASVPADAHQLSGDWVVSLKAVNFRPFALAGGGILFNVPTAGAVTVTTCPVEGSPPCYPLSYPTGTSVKAVFVYGVGLDWSLLPHIGLRLQYRGNLYKAPALIKALSSSNAFTQTAEPMIGIFFRF